MLGICVGSSRCSLPLSPVSCSTTKTDGVDLDAASLNSVQFEEDFNSRTKKSVRSGGWLSQTRPIPRSPDGDNKSLGKELKSNIS